MKTKIVFFLLIVIVVAIPKILFAQEDEEPILYYQMEPLDDSLFIHIQEQLFIDPPDPKAEIVVDVRDANNQTISIKGSLYPFLALKPELRALVITYPFKLNLEETVNYSSVFVRVLNKLRFDKIINPPSVFQISPGLGYINPYIQLMGGERFGIPLKKDVGISFGMGTPYSGPLETNFFEVNFHILGAHGGIFSSADVFTEQKSSENHNNLFVTSGYQFSYVIPFGNFFEIGYLSVTDTFAQSQVLKYTKQTVNKDNIVLNPDGSIKYQPYLLDGSFINWELRYPLKILAATRGKVYVARFLDETHVGFMGREMALAGSVFDLRVDAMVSSPVRQPQVVFDLEVQKIFDYWAFSTIAVGPSIIMTNLKSGSFGFSSLYFNMRIKVGSVL
jgi:hypothetical protein